MKTLKWFTVFVSLLWAAQPGRLPGANLNKGLVAFYKFDGNGKNAAGRGLELIGYGPTYQPGRFGQAASFNGNGDYFQTRENFPVVSNHSRSISVWLKPKRFSGRANIVGWGTFDSSLSRHDNEGVGRYWGLYLTPPASGQMLINAHWRLYSSGPAFFEYPLEEWINLAVAYDKKTDMARFYLNGDYVGGYLSEGNSATSVNTAFRPLFVGFFQPYLQPGGYEWLATYNGLMDNLRIYNRELTPDEVRALAESPKTGDLDYRAQRAGQTKQRWHAASVNSIY